MTIYQFKKQLNQKIINNKVIMVVADKDGVLCSPHKIIKPVKEIFDIVEAGGLFTIISGAAIDRVKIETIEPLLKMSKNKAKFLKKIFLITNNGAAIYHFQNGSFKCIYKKSLKNVVGAKEIKKTIKILEETRNKFDEIKKIKNLYPFIQQINNEGVQIVLRALGKIDNNTLRKKFDPDGNKRKIWATYIRKRLKQEKINLSVSVDGTSSINILVPEINKGSSIDYLIKRLGIKKSALLYLGDAFHDKRNDRIAVKDRINLAVNFGKKIKKNIPGTYLLNSSKQGALGSKIILKIIYQFLKLNK